MHTHRREHSLSLTRLALFACLLAESTAAAVNQPPNVVLIMTDDQGYGDVHLHGNAKIDTPNLDRLAQQGARFDRFFVSPICAPTRAALMTGRYFLRTGVIEVVPDYLATMSLDEVTLAEAFKQAGYATGIFGKWHLGKWYPYHPNRQGFDEFLGFRSGAFGNYFDPLLEHNGKPAPTRGYITDVLTDRAIAFIRKNRKRPFFCYLPYNVPHSPLQVPDRYFDKYKARGLNDRTAAVYGMCDNMDENVGRLLATLDSLQLAGKTIVLFLSDNGPAGARYNAGMRGRKGNVDEGGVRVPLFVRWPKRIRAGKVITQLASVRDLFPTLIDLCGISMPETKPLDGRSLAPLLLGQDTDWPERRFFSVRVDERFGGRRTIKEIGVRTNRWRLTIKGKRVALYDMRSDPRQRHNVASKHPKEVVELRRAIDAWKREMMNHLPARVPIPVGYRAEPVVRLESPDSHLHGRITVQGKVAWDIQWIHHWTGTDDYTWWDIEAVHDGTYDVAITYSAPGDSPPVNVRVEAGRACLDATLPATKRRADEPTKARRDRVPRRLTVVPAQSTRSLGRMTIRAGRQRFYLRVLSPPGPQFQVSRITLQRIGESPSPSHSRE